MDTLPADSVSTALGTPQGIMLVLVLVSFGFLASLIMIVVTWARKEARRNGVPDSMQKRHLALVERVADLEVELRGLRADIRSLRRTVEDD